MSDTPAPRLDADLPSLADAIVVADGALALVGDPGRHATTVYSGVAFYEEGGSDADWGDQIVLAAGITTSVLERVRSEAMRAGAAALVVRASAESGADGPLAESAPIATLALQGGDWAQLATVLRSLLSGFAIGNVKGVRLGDVFGLANALATLAEGAVSIVDSTGQVVGYSTHADQPIDDIRRRSTLLLQEEVPLAQDPEYQAILRAGSAMHFPSADDQFGRVGVAVRAAGELLGSIWVIQPEIEGVTRTLDLLDEMAPIAAQHLLRARDNAADKDRRDAELLRALIEEQRGARSAASQLLLRPEAGCTVVCFRVDTYDEVLAVRGLQRLMHLAMSLATSTFAGSYSATVGPQVVTLVPGAVPARVRTFAESVVRTDAALVAGIGTRVSAVPAIARSYREAAATAALLMSPSPDAVPGGARVAVFDEVRDRLALTQIGDVAEELEVAVGDAASRLLAHDVRQGTDLARTVLAFLNLRGSVRETAAALHVHQNTVRYRLETIGGELGIDLDDAATRLWLWVRLHTHAQRGPRTDEAVIAASAVDRVVG